MSAGGVVRDPGFSDAARDAMVASRPGSFEGSEHAAVQTCAASCRVHRQRCRFRQSSESE
jgi:hypothetical protein